MFQYKAILKSSKEIVAQGHSVEEVEHQIVSYRRGQKRGEHTRANENIEIYHIQRNQKEGNLRVKEELIKVV